MNDDDKAAQALRTFENRLVWLVTFGIAQARGRSTEDAASDADKGLDEYQTRFPAVGPDGTF